MLLALIDKIVNQCKLLFRNVLLTRVTRNVDVYVCLKT